MARAKTGGGGGTVKAGAADDTLGLWVAAAIVGFFAVPMLAGVSPTLVNGVLLLVLFSSLLLNRDRWLPYMRQLEGST